MPENKIHKAAVETLARLLAKTRERKGLSMHQVSQKSGLGLTTISYIERGLRSPSFDSLLRIATVLDVELWKLVREACAKARKSKQ